MNIIVVSGSSRPESQSHKIAAWAEEKLKALGATTFFIDLHTLSLPLDINLDVVKLSDAPEALDAWQSVRDHMNNADGFLIVSPEWNGMAPPALLNFILYASADEHKPLAHKPIQLFTASSGGGGNYPVAQLHSFGMKNAHGVYIPGYVAIRKCHDVFNSPQPQVGNESDTYLQKRAKYSLKVLLHYAESLKTLRQDPPVDLLAYPNGM